MFQFVEARVYNQELDRGVVVLSKTEDSCGPAHTFPPDANIVKAELPYKEVNNTFGLVAFKPTETDIFSLRQACACEVEDDQTDIILREEVHQSCALCSLASMGVEIYQTRSPAWWSREELLVVLRVVAFVVGVVQRRNNAHSQRDVRLVPHSDVEAAHSAMLGHRDTVQPVVIYWIPGVLYHVVDQIRVSACIILPACHCA